MKRWTVRDGLKWAAVLAAALALSPSPRAWSQEPPPPQGVSRGENFSAKPPAALFASDCTGAGCHKGPQGLGKSQGIGGLSGFLREHYTNSRESAASMAAFLTKQPGGPEPKETRNPRGRVAATPPANVPAPASPPQSQPSRSALENFFGTAEPKTDPKVEAKPELEPEGKSKAKEKETRPVRERGSRTAARPADEEPNARSRPAAESAEEPKTGEGGKPARAPRGRQPATAAAASAPQPAAAPAAEAPSEPPSPAPKKPPQQQQYDIFD